MKQLSPMELNMVSAAEGIFSKNLSMVRNALVVFPTLSELTQATGNYVAGCFGDDVKDNVYVQNTIYYTSYAVPATVAILAYYNAGPFSILNPSN